ncbi:hypothetical protein RGQ29_001150 [Quercus rubra]|uniref:Uncharacterized protein n=1 Tax=Quercus rubra TaxID=3512 RepID=A0AAN7JDL1_QUERU|nr:hypothetical protein RGQ29_001150 [Quercus rubra]
MHKVTVVGLSQLHILSLSLSLSLSRVLLPLKKLRLLLLPCPSISSLHPISVPHLLTTEGFLKDQIVLILFKVLGTLLLCISRIWEW